MNELPRIPYGMAKRIVLTMAIGDACWVRPQWVVPFHNAARRLGMRLASVSATHHGIPMVRVIRVDEGWAATGHLFSRQPRREQFSGRWRRDAA